MAVATTLLCLFGAIVMDLGYRLRAVSHHEILVYACGNRLGRLMDKVLTLFLGVTLSVMVAGAGAIFAEHFGLPNSIGILLTAVLAGATILGRMKGIVAANVVVVPVLTLTVVGLTFSSIQHHGVLSIIEGAVPLPEMAPVRSWLLAALLYVGYNVVLSIAVLGPLGAEIKDRRALFAGALIGGLVLGLLGVGITLAVVAHLPRIAQVEIPMLYLARLHPSLVQWIYVVILWAEIFTTAIACAYGFATRASEALRLSYRNTVVLVTAMALLGSGFGFSNLISFLYPVFGFVTLVVLAGLTATTLK